MLSAAAESLKDLFALLAGEAEEEIGVFLLDDLVHLLPVLGEDLFAGLHSLKPIGDVELEGLFRGPFEGQHCNQVALKLLHLENVELGL